jgi:hypothetical protein
VLVHPYPGKPLSCIVISVAISLILWLINQFRR